MLSPDSKANSQKMGKVGEYSRKIRKGMRKMKKKNRMLFFSVSILLLSALIFLSACGKEQEPAKEETWLTKLEQLAVETVIENSEMNGSMVERGELEVAIDKIHSGSFSRENANEIFLDCKLLHMPHIGGLDTRAGILLDADTLEMIAYKDFEGDHMMLHCLQTAKGQNRILSLAESGGQGYRWQWFELWGVRDGEWEELPTGIEELIPEEHKEITTGVNGAEIGTGDSFCYMAGGGRLVVTFEEDIAFGVRVPSELSVILVWNPFQERFELPTNVEQPSIQQD